jgi:predicted RNase H-like HicB family nuclease
MARGFEPPQSTMTFSMDECKSTAMNITFETEQDVDGRWIAEVPELPGVMAYGATQEQAITKAEALALRVLAERLENAEATPMDVSIIS